MKYDIGFGSTNKQNLIAGGLLLHGIGARLGGDGPIFAGTVPQGQFAAIVNQGRGSLHVTAKAAYYSADPGPVKEYDYTNGFFNLDEERGLHNFARALARPLAEGAQEWKLSDAERNVQRVATVDRAAKAIRVSDGPVTLAQLQEMEAALEKRTQSWPIAQSGRLITARPDRGYVESGCVRVPLATIKEMIKALTA